MARRIVEIGKGLTSKLKGFVPLSQQFTVVLNETTYIDEIDDATQLIMLYEPFHKTVKSPKNCCLWNQWNTQLPEKILLNVQIVKITLCTMELTSSVCSMMYINETMLIY